MLRRARWISYRTSDKPFFEKNKDIKSLYCSWNNLKLLHLDQHQTQVITCPSASNRTSVRALSCLLIYVFYICFEDELTDKHKLWKLKSKMSVISLSLFNKWVAYIYFKFLVLCNNIKNVFREKAVPSRAKKQQSSDIKSFYSNTSDGFSRT